MHRRCSRESTSRAIKAEEKKAQKPGEICREHPHEQNRKQPQTTDVPIEGSPRQATPRAAARSAKPEPRETRTRHPRATRGRGTAEPEEQQNPPENKKQKKVSEVLLYLTEAAAARAIFTITRDN
ncbi:MAG: hypothetical protein ACTSP1_05895 [Candidatus Freyarchaeota archaeon]